MSNWMVKFALLNTKVVVNAYTALTLPFYTIYQRPWNKLRLSKSFDLKSKIDKHGRTVYYRPAQNPLDHPYYKTKTYAEMLQVVDKNRPAIGFREIISESLQLDENGKPLIIDEKEVTKLELSKEYKWLTVGQVLERVDTIARGLKELGIQRGDKVMIYADSGFEWFLLALAITRLCAITTTLFSTLGKSGVLYGLNQSEAKYLIVGETLLTKINQIKNDIKHVEKIVYIPITPKSFKKHDPTLKKAKEEVSKKFSLISLDEIRQNGEKIAPYEFPLPEENDYMLIMYTSGTTGNPKGVMLTYKSVHASMLAMLNREQEQEFSVFSTTSPAFLPMAHLYGYMVNLMIFCSKGRIAFSSPMTLLSSSPAHVPGQKGDIDLIQPEFLPTVPLILERLIKEIYRKLNARSPIAGPVFTYLIDYKIRWSKRGYDTPIINRLICKKINEQFGGKLNIMCVSGASIHERTHAFAKAALNLDVLYNIYGNTEVCGAAIAMTDTDRSYGRSGVPYSIVKYYLDDWSEGGYSTKDKPNPRGEVVLGGEIVSHGYYKMPEATKQDFYTDEEGTRWFKTGDIGEVFPDGTLKIIDRKKDLTKLANGEFISLGKIESGLRSSSYVENVCVCTNPFRNEIIALIMPNRRTFEILSKQMNKEHLSFEQMCDDPEVNKIVFESIQNKCKELEFKKPEIPVRIELVKEEWTQDNNMLTAAFKLRRNPVYNFYQNKIKEIYEEIAQQTQKEDSRQ